MSRSRRGLKRAGFLGSYIVEGPGGAMMIDRERYPARWYVRRDWQPRVAGGFFVMEFRLLREARAYAEGEVGL